MASAVAPVNCQQSRDSQQKIRETSPFKHPHLGPPKSRSGGRWNTPTKWYRIGIPPALTGASQALRAWNPKKSPKGSFWPRCPKSVRNSLGRVSGVSKQAFLVRTSSTTTRDRNLQFRGAVSTGGSPLDFLFFLQCLCAI